MGWLGMELGIAQDLLQPRSVGRLGRWIPSSESLVSATPCGVQPASGVWGQLGLSATELSSSQTDSQPCLYSTGDTARQTCHWAGRQPACDSSGQPAYHWAGESSS